MDPPENTSRTRLKSTESICALISNSVNTVGTPATMVGGTSRISLIMRSALNSATITTVPPPTKWVSAAQVMPPTWFSGLAMWKTSSAHTRVCTAWAVALASRLWWVSPAPLGRPVVPEV